MAKATAKTKPRYEYSMRTAPIVPCRQCGSKRRTMTVARERIDEATGYRRSSRDAYLTRLKARGLVDVVGPGAVRVSPTLMEG